MSRTTISALSLGIGSRWGRWCCGISRGWRRNIPLPHPPPRGRERTWEAVSRVKNARLCEGLLGRIPFEKCQELVFLVGLAHVFVHAELERVVAVLVRRARGDHDDRDRLRGCVRAHVAREFEA